MELAKTFFLNNSDSNFFVCFFVFVLFWVLLVVVFVFCVYCLRKKSVKTVKMSYFEPLFLVLSIWKSVLRKNE